MKCYEVQQQTEPKPEITMENTTKQNMKTNTEETSNWYLLVFAGAIGIILALAGYTQIGLWIILIVLVIAQVIFLISTRSKINQLKDFQANLKLQGEFYPQVYSVSANLNKITGNIVNYLNDYLKNNYGKPVNFGIVKDIVNREFDLRDEEISQAIPTPLYLGLAGTMIGIIIGLWSMPDFKEQEFYEGINTLIQHVQYAMMVSLLGLIFTTGLSAWYKDVKAKADEKRNKLLSYLQAQLLPKLLEADETGQMQIHEKLETFINQLNGIVENINRQTQETYIQTETVREVLQEANDIASLQFQTIHELNNMELDKITDANLKLYEGVSKSLEKLETFAQYLNALTYITENMKTFAERTQQIEELHRELKETIERSNRIMLFLDQHYRKIEEVGKEAAKAVNSADAQFSEAVETLTQKIQEQFATINDHANKLEIHTKEILENLDEEFQKVTAEYINNIRQTLADSMETEKLNKLEKLEEIYNFLKSNWKGEELNKLEKLEQLNKLEKLELLEKIHKALAENKPDGNNAELVKTLQELNQIISKLGNSTAKTQPKTHKKTSYVRKKQNETLPLTKVINSVLNSLSGTEKNTKNGSNKNSK